MNDLQFNGLGTLGTAQTDFAFRGLQNPTPSYGNTGAWSDMRPVYRTPDRFTSQYPQPPGCSGGDCGTTGLPGQSGLLGLLQGMFAGIQSAMQQMAGYFNGGQSANQTAVQDATVTSWGDPHLGITGTDANGNTLNTHFDSMTGHHDLIDSDSFDGGYRVSTQVTQPAANGVTYNKSATITSNYGQNNVTFDKDGNLTIETGGQALQENGLQAGQSITMPGGETVTKNQDGSVTVVNDNGQGGTITTTLKSNGSGVDVSAQAHNIDVGGDVANHGNGPPVDPHPIHGPIPDGDDDDKYLTHFTGAGAVNAGNPDANPTLWGIRPRTPQTWA